MTALDEARVIVVTGTSTGVGKTVVTAALATLAAASGRRVAVVKPAQTGTAEGDSDIREISRLSGLADADLHELAAFPEPLAPGTAARRSGLAPLNRSAAEAAIVALGATHDLVLVEGAGGVLVAYDDPPRAWTVADLAADLDAPALVVAAAGLGTLNHTALTLEALAARGVEAPGVVLGAWPAAPDLAERSNLSDLSRVVGVELLGALPADAAGLGRADFADVALAGLAPVLGGRFDAADFLRLHAPPSTTEPKAPA